MVLGSWFLVSGLMVAREKRERTRKGMCELFLALARKAEDRSRKSEDGGTDSKMASLTLIRVDEFSYRMNMMVCFNGSTLQKRWPPMQFAGVH